MNLIDTAQSNLKTIPLSHEKEAKSSARQSLIQGLWDAMHFLLRYAQNPAAIGSISPSSVFLAKKIVQFIPTDDDGQARRYLEVGAGTGAFTGELIKKMKANDQLDIVELDPYFCKLLKEKFKKPQVHVHCVPIEQWKPDYQYDAIVSGLPLNSFPPRTGKKDSSYF